MAKKNGNGTDEPLEKQLWKSADKLRKNIDAAEYKHVVLGLIFLKYISDAFEELYEKLKAGEGDFAGADPEDKDEYKAENVFFVPTDARWNFLLSKAKQPTIGKTVDDAMDAIEKENPSLKGVLPKVYARQNLDPTSLGELIDLIGNIALGDAKSRSADILGHVFEYFLGEFALAEGKKGGQFYTPRSVVELLVEMLEPYKGRVFDPCCGSGGMFVQSEKFVEQHKGKINDISIYGQESNQTTWRLAKMNLAIRGIDSSQVKWNNEGSFLNDAHKDLKCDYIIANPPFNVSDWSGDLLRKDGRWQYGVPPIGNANYAWIQHFIHHLSPNGNAGFVLSNSSLSAERTGEVEIRKSLVENGLIKAIVVLPKNLFYNTSISACLWFISRNDKKNKDILFIDARKLGVMIDKTHRILEKGDINKIAETYHSWRNITSNYMDIMHFCKSVKVDEVRKNKYNLSPNLYIDFEKLNENKNVNASEFESLFNSLSQDNRKSLEEQIQNNIDIVGLHELENIAYSTISGSQLLKIEKLIFNRLFFHFIIPDIYGKIELREIENKDFNSIPDGWTIKRLTDVARVIDCLHSKKPSQINDSEFALLEVNNIGENGLLELDEKYFISEDDYKLWTKNIEVTTGDCIITNTGRVGAVAQIPEDKAFAIGRNMTAVRVKNESLTPTYLINYLLSHYMQFETYRKTDIGTILDSLNVKGIKKVLVLVPPIDLLIKYESFARPLRRLIEISFGN
jgi:type I restriction enzyme M protein